MVSSHTEDGALRIEKVDFSDFRGVEGSGLDLPRLVKLFRTVTTEDSLLHLTIAYQIDVLEVGSEIEDSLFTFDPASFKRVWAGDRQQFLKGTTCPSRSPSQ